MLAVPAPVTERMEHRDDKLNIQKPDRHFDSSYAGGRALSDWHLSGGVRPMRTSLCLPLDARTYAEQSWRRSERAALRLVLKLARE